MGIEETLEAIVRKVVREEFSRNGDEDIELLTADQVAEKLGFSDRRSVYNLKREGKLKAFNLGGENGNTLRFSKAEVRRFLEEHPA